MNRLLALWILAGWFQIYSAEKDPLNEIIEKRGALLAEIHGSAQGRRKDWEEHPG